MSFLVLPPEVNSARMHLGAGSGPMLAAASEGLAGELGSAATSFGSVTSGLSGASWQGRAAVSVTVHPGAVAANRSRLVSLVSSNLLGQNAPAIAAAEAEYERMWAQDVAAVVRYHGDAATTAGWLTPFQRLAQAAGNTP